MHVTTSLLGAILIRVLAKRADGCKRVQEGAQGCKRVQGYKAGVAAAGRGRAGAGAPGRRPAPSDPRARASRVWRGGSVARELPSTRRSRPLRPPYRPTRQVAHSGADARRPPPAARRLRAPLDPAPSLCSIRPALNIKLSASEFRAVRAITSFI